MILERPSGAWALYVFAHGAGAGMSHSFMTAMSAELHQLGIATLRYDFPYMAQGKRRIDPKPVLEQSVRDAVAKASGDLPLFAGGKSMGGRMTSQAQAAQPLQDVRGLVFIGFPLHPAGEPATKRADHLRDVRIPMLFLQGTRDELADLGLLKPIVATLPGATLHIVDGADHAFHVLKRSGRTDEQIRTGLAQTAAQWMQKLL